MKAAIVGILVTLGAVGALVLKRPAPRVEVAKEQACERVRVFLLDSVHVPLDIPDVDEKGPQYQAWIQSQAAIIKGSVGECLAGLEKLRNTDLETYNTTASCFLAARDMDAVVRCNQAATVALQEKSR